MDDANARVEDAIFEEVGEITFEVWSLPYEGNPAQQVAYGIPTLEDAWALVSRLGGEAMFQVRDSSGAYHYYQAQSASDQDLSNNPGHPSFYKTERYKALKRANRQATLYDLKMGWRVFVNSPTLHKCQAFYVGLLVVAANTFAGAVLGRLFGESTSILFAVAALGLTVAYYLRKGDKQ